MVRSVWIMMRGKSKTKVPKSRLPFLEGLRGVAALYVVLGHVCTLADPSTSYGRTSHAPEWLQKTMACFSFGHLAVAAFIVISGFCLELSLFSRENGILKRTGRFYVRRALRILPPYYACLALSILVALRITQHQIGYPFIVYLPVDLGAILSHIFLVQNFWLDWMYRINGVLWSIAIEIQLYIVFPLFVWSINRMGRLLTFTGTGGIAYAAIVLLPQAPKMYAWYAFLFVAGMVAAHLALKPGKIGQLPVVGSLLSIGSFYGCYYAAANLWPMYASDVLLGVGIAGVCYAMTGAPRGPLYRFLGLRPVVGLGTFSYSLYLMHHPIAQVLYAYRPRWADGEASLFCYFVGCLPLILLGCWIFYLVFERPFVPKPTVKPTPNPKTHAPSDLPLRTYRPRNANG